MSFKINHTGICIRPSSVDSSIQCGYQWAKVFLEGVTTIPNARAAIGTAIHAAVEAMWKEAIEVGKADPNVDMMYDAGVECFKEQAKDGLSYDSGENIDTANKEIVQGALAFVEDCVPFLPIPDSVETRFSMKISGHPIVNELGGTVDYLKKGDRLDDVKTSKRKPIATNYTTQQTIYKLLAEHNGIEIPNNYIQGVVLGKKGATGTILEMPTNVPRTKYIVNNLLDRLQLLAEDKINPDLLFTCNPKYYLCSEKYCSLHGSCPATKKVNTNG